MRFQFTHDGETVTAIERPEKRWEESTPLPLRTRIILPDSEPSHCDPTQVILKCEGKTIIMPLDQSDRTLLIGIKAQFKLFDLDL